MTNSRTRTLPTAPALALFFVFGAGCGDSTSNEDAGVADTGNGPTDSGIHADATVADTGIHPDASAPDLGRPDSGEEADAGEGPDAGEVDAGEVQVTFTDIFDTIITPNCSCHQGASHPSGLTMATRASALANLVNADTSQVDCTDLSRVEPGDPQNSTLYLKVTGTGCGTSMPFGSTLSAPNAAMIEAWISAGAQDN